MTRALLLATVALCLAPAPASPSTDWFAVSRAAAWEHWGGLPPCGEPRWELVTPELLAAEHGVRGVLGDADASTCTIRLAPTPRWTPGDWCATVVHEVGHLFGQRHRDRTIMAAYSHWDDWRFSRACVRRIRYRVVACKPKGTFCERWSYRRP